MAQQLQFIFLDHLIAEGDHLSSNFFIQIPRYPLCTCMCNKFFVCLHGENNIVISFMETPRKFIITIVNLRGVSARLNWW